MTERGSGAVRVTVASATRRVDLVLPGAVPVAELVPELARSVGLLDRATAHAGYRLLTVAGHELETEAGLTAQGVQDGGLLTLSRVDAAGPRADDDPAEVMADVVERDAPWDERHRRHALWSAGAGAATLGAAALLTPRDSSLAGPAAVGLAVVFTTGAVLVSRTGRSAAAPVLGILGTAYAAVAGFVLVPGDGAFAARPGAAGGGLLLAGLVCLVGLRAGRTSALPAVVVGAMLLAAGLLSRGTGLDPAVLLAAGLVLVVLADAAFPTIALAATGTTGRHLDEAGDAPVDRARLAADARLAHEILLALSATAGVLLVVVAPLAVSLGAAGTVLAALCCLVTLLRTRRHRARATIVVGLVTGGCGLVGAVATALWVYAGWRPLLSLFLCLVGVLLVLAALAPPRTGVSRLSRLADLAETAALLSLLPLLVVTAGVVDALGP